MTVIHISEPGFVPIDQTTVLIAPPGHEVGVAGNGALAVDAARRNAYDLKAMDIRRPVLDGEPAMHQIPASGGTVRTVPIFAMTASGPVQQASLHLATGMHAVRGEPLNLRERDTAPERLARANSALAGPVRGLRQRARST